MSPASSESFPGFVRDQLDALGPVECRRMFGGYGLYHGRVFFGIIDQGRLYFKTDARSQPKYRAAGMCPFRPSAKQTLKTYYEVPVDVLEDPEAAVTWAREALRSQTDSPKRVR